MKSALERNSDAPGLLKRLLSYLIPVTLKRHHSKVNGPLEINLINGRKVLDTATTNYSYGSLQRVLHRGLSEIGFDHSIRNILVLGLGGGSIVQTIREDFGSEAHIELIDIDPEIIEVATREFEILRYDNIKIIEADAVRYVRSCDQQFDLIVVDVFIDDTIPTGLTGPSFIQDLIGQLTPGGKIIFNTLSKTLPKEVFSKMLSEFSTGGMNVRVLENIEDTNNLILGEKQKSDRH